MYPIGNPIAKAASAMISIWIGLGNIPSLKATRFTAMTVGDVFFLVFSLTSDPLRWSSVIGGRPCLLEPGVMAEDNKPLDLA